MNKIPNAEEWLKNVVHHSQVKELTDVLQKFAKLHVQAALQAAKKEAMKFCDENEDEDYKPQIIESYPLTNIK